MSEEQWHVVIMAWIFGFAWVAIWWRFLRVPSWENQMIDFELRQLKRTLDALPPPPES